jgi:hypothetical protein
MPRSEAGIEDDVKEEDVLRLIARGFVMGGGPHAATCQNVTEILPRARKRGKPQKQAGGLEAGSIQEVVAADARRL